MTDARETAGFYDALADDYHLVFTDWDASVARQGAALDAVIRHHARGPARTVLDATCGIGTQALALAGLGYRVTGSDLSPAAVERARREAARRHLEIDFHVADLRNLAAVVPGPFDVVVSADNSLPHLLTDAGLSAALESVLGRLRPGGLALITTRDYDAVQPGPPRIHPRHVHETPEGRVILFDVWDFHGETYTLSLYRLREGPAGHEVRVARTEYRLLRSTDLLRLMAAAGFQGSRLLDPGGHDYYQAVFIGHRPSPA